MLVLALHHVQHCKAEILTMEKRNIFIVLYVNILSLSTLKCLMMAF